VVLDALLRLVYVPDVDVEVEVIGVGVEVLLTVLEVERMLLTV